MANKRNHEWPLASVVDGFFTQDKAGGSTQRVPLSLIVSSIQGQNVFQPKGDAPADHASDHHAGGGDALVGSSIAGLQATDSVEFAGLTLRGNVFVKQDTTISSNSTDGNEQTALTLAGGGAGGPTRGAYVVARGNERPSSGGTLTLAAGDGVQGNIEVATGGVVRATWRKAGELDLATTLQVGGVDAITIGREIRGTGMRLSNFAAGQIPVASDGNGQITPSGLTDDGTFLGISRTLRAWNSMARSGNTWADLQWTQDAQERVSMFSSNGSGVGSYHTLALVPADAEATGRGLGGLLYGQKVSGKSGVNPGIKAAIYADSIGAGGSVGGFGAKIKLRYRPDNGNDLVDALRIGAFGGSTVDAVETAILLRVNAGMNIQGLGSAGALVADSAGAVSVVDKTERFRSSGVIPTYNSVEQSVLGQASAKRLIPANTVNTGDELEVICDFRCTVDGSAQTWNFYLGPDATYTASYRPSFTFSNQQLGTSGQQFNHRVVFLVRFINAAYGIGARGRMTIERTIPDTYNTGFSVVYSTDFTIVFDRNLDRYFDLAAIINSGNTSVFSDMLVFAEYRKAF